MAATTTKIEKIFIIMICLLAWFATGLQLFIMIDNSATSGQTLPVIISRFLGYFTILTNLLIAIALTSELVGSGRLYRFFSKTPVKTAIAVYIFAVGLGYNFLLRHIWHPQGLQRIADELLHVVVPALYVLYWFMYTPKSGLRWRYILPWLLYPFLYLVFALTRGSIDGFYAYYFIDVSKLGYLVVLKNALLLFVVLVVISALFIAVGRTIAKSKWRIASG
jgi:hypothetical protein